MMFPCPDFFLEQVDEIPSTNEALLARREEAGFHGRALLARRQTQGVGRRGRTWEGGEGNLFLSVGLRLPASASFSLLPFLAGVALHEALGAHLPPEADLRLKWPNDLYLDGKKLAGLLAQARQGAEGIDLVLGLGLNLRQAPASLPAVALGEGAPEPADFARSFLHFFGRKLQETKDFSTLRNQWERAARLNGAKVEVLGEAVVYECERLCENGELAVKAPNGVVRRLSSEEVSLRLVF